MIKGYIRVSTAQQKEDRQWDELTVKGVPSENIYTDKQSGKDFNRKEYKKMFLSLRRGDVLVIKSIDRLGRNYGEILEEWRKITKKKGADIIVLVIIHSDDAIDFAGNIIGKDISDKHAHSISCQIVDSASYLASHGLCDTAFFMARYAPVQNKGIFTLQGSVIFHIGNLPERPVCRRGHVVICIGTLYLNDGSAVVVRGFDDNIAPAQTTLIV